MSLICITGTPGVGKSTLSRFLEEKKGFDLISVNNVAEEENLFIGRDPIKGYFKVDLKGLCDHIENLEIREPTILEGHLSHFCRRCDKVIVMRLDPEKLKKRLDARGYPPEKVLENLEAEALGVCTIEAYEIHGERVYEVDATEKSIQELSDVVMKISEGIEGFQPGSVDFSEWLIQK